MMNNLGIQLKQEISKSPIKAGLLGLVLLAALYFWVPLLAGLFANPKSTEASLDLSKPVLPLAVMAALPATPAYSTPWYELDKSMKTDPRKNLSGAYVSGRDPFAFPFESKKPGSSSQVAVKTRDLVTPSDLGLTLTSTIVSPGRSTASISGEIYRVGEKFQKVFEGHSVWIQLQEIHSRQVKIKIDGNSFVLRILRTTSEKVRILRQKK